jgi:hypothetical protein
MLQMSRFQVDEHEALQQVVVKDQINVKILRLRADALLASDEGEALAKLQQELLELVPGVWPLPLLLGLS